MAATATKRTPAKKTTRRAPAKPAGPPIIHIQEMDEGFNILVYADPGVGKTVLAGSGEGVLFLATEKGTKAAARQGSKAKVWRINVWDDLQSACDWLEENPDAFKWVAIDSLTEMQQLCMRAVLDAAVAENASRDPDIPALQDWQKYYNMFLRFVKSFNNLSVNIIYTATTVRHEDEDGEPLLLPNIQGRGYAMAASVCAEMDCVGYLSIQRIGKGDEAMLRRTVLWQSQPPYFAKDRLDTLGRRMLMTEEKDGTIRKVNDLTTITGKLNGARNKPTGATPAKKATATKAAAPTKRPARRRPAAV